MKALCLLAICGSLVVTAAGSQESDLAKLQGTWALVSVEIDGKALPMDDLKESRLVIKDKEYLFRFREARLDINIKLDSSRTPKAIDLLVVDGPDKGNTYKGIYILDGDHYKICRHTTPGQDRPATFATHPESGLMMTVWRREKS